MAQTRKVRLIVTENTKRLTQGYAREEAIVSLAHQSIYTDTIIVHDFRGKGVSIGFGQPISHVNTDYCKKHGYALTRRITGGWAVDHTDKIWTGWISKGNVLEEYTKFISLLLKELGIKNEYDLSHGIQGFAGVSDEEKGKRIAGHAAQLVVVRDGKLITTGGHPPNKLLKPDMQDDFKIAHGLLNLDKPSVEMHENLFSTDPNLLRPKLTGISDFTSTDRIKVQETLVELVMSLMGSDLDFRLNLEPEEEELAKKLEKRYMDQAWLEKKWDKFSGVRIVKGEDCLAGEVSRSLVSEETV